MRLIDIIKKYGFQATTGTITILAYKDAIYTHKAELEKAKLRSMQDEKALENLHTFLVERTTPIRIKANQVAEKEKELEKLTNQIKEYKDKIDNKLLGTHENENTMNLMIDYWTNEKKNLKVEIDKTGSEITSIINGWEKSATFDWLFNYIDQYKEFISALNLEQLVALYNIIGYFMIISTLFSICLILLGDSFIKWLDLETKYPKLAQIFKTRAVITKTYLKFYVVILFVLILINIGVNIYMIIISF